MEFRECARTPWCGVAVRPSAQECVERLEKLPTGKPSRMHRPYTTAAATGEHLLGQHMSKSGLASFDVCALISFHDQTLELSMVPRTVDTVVASELIGFPQGPSIPNDAKDNGLPLFLLYILALP